ncbi:MAG: NAD(P)H-dependent oxidoreductase [Bacteroidales bacterium]|nr:NAD(P)H-dependent oxidoreductase [Bacteroidales bacterium]
MFGNPSRSNEDPDESKTQIEKIREADLVIWLLGLWVLAVPAQYMRFIVLISERNAADAFKDKYTAL